MNHTLTDVPGILVGHITHLEGATGCTVVLCPPGTVGGVDQRGGGPGTRETDLLRPTRAMEQVNAVLLAGGSAFGLAAADGVMRYLEEHGIGYKAISGVIVPIVPTAIVFDLLVGEPGIRPDAGMGYAACEAATRDPVPQGTVGAGTGCRVGAMWGNEFALKGGVGSASIDLGDGLMVAALIVVNAVGDILDEQGEIMAGLRRQDGGGFADMLQQFRMLAQVVPPQTGRENTVIGVVATNARLSKAHINKVAEMAQAGVARVVRPAHTMHDGDTMFALATGEIPANVSVIGAFAAEAVTMAIRNAIRIAVSLGGVRSWQDFQAD
jgi:L-aminopeptidase/D-esterase-like protein